MTDLFFFLILTSIAVLLIILPYLRRQGAPARETFDLAVYQDQLAELERDLERGVVDAEAARAAKLEIQRRILALAERSGRTSLPAAQQGRLGSVLTALLVVIVPLASAFVYFQLGRPHMRDVPLASRILPEQQVAGRDSVLANIQQIQERIEGAPEDTTLWISLARTQLRASLYSDAAGSFNKALEFGGENPMLRAELGEAIVSGAEGLVTPGAMDQFRQVLENAPNEPRSRYYIGLASAQEGNVDEAVNNWRELLEVSPSNAAWRPQIIQAIRSVLESNGRPADEIIASLPKGGAPAVSPDMDEAHAQNDQIRAMVDGLAERLENEPDDIEGWLMLGRSRMVLEEPELAKAAFERAMALAPDRPEVLLGYASSLLKPGETPDSDPIVNADAATVYEKLTNLTPDDPAPRWLLGLAAAQSGDKAAAIGHWQDLLGLIEGDADDKAIVEARIDALKEDDSAAALAAGAPSLAPNLALETASTEVSSGPEPTAEDRAEMASLSPDERTDRIRGMVESLAARLEDDPSDVEGWLRLAQSRTVLGEPEAATEAYRQAMEQAPEDTNVLRSYASSLLGAPHAETNVASVSEEAASIYQKIIEIEPNDPEAHWYLGLAAVQEGTIDVAKTHWRLVLDVLGPEHPNYAAVQSSLEQVETKTQ